MKELKKNKNIILICLSIISVALLVALVINKAPGEAEEYELSTEEFLKNYQINEVIPVSISKEQMARIYLSEYITLINHDPEKAYSLLDEDYKMAAYPTYEDFTEYIEQIKSDKFTRAVLAKYEVKNQAQYRVYDLVDSAGNNFVFHETSIMNYRVLLDNYTL